MQFLTTDRYPLLAFLLSAALLGGAWIFQYGLGYAPCQMCYWQRDGHKAVIAIALLVLVLMKAGIRYPVIMCTVIVLALLVSAGLGGWHMGVEYGWWEGPQSCMGSAPDLGTINPDDLLAALDKKIKPPSCGDVVWSFLGLSMAAWNMILSLVGVIAGLIAIGRSRSM